MKNKLLLTTALAGAVFAVSANAKVVEGTKGYLIPQGETYVLEENSLVQNNTSDIGGAFSTSKPGKNGAGKLVVKSGTVFKNNTADYDGGAIGSFGILEIDGAKFEANKSQLGTTDSQPIGGGAISLGIDAVTTISNTEFVGNETGFNGGAIGTRRTINNGDIANQSHNNHSLVISNSKFVGNTATGKTTDQSDNKLTGGFGGAIANSFNNTQISNSTFTNNKAVNGGAVYNQSLFNTNNQTQEVDKGGNIKFADVTFSGNTASANGGAIYSDRNTKTDLTGKVDFTGNTADNAGGAIFVADASSKMDIASGATIKNNSAKLGGAIYNRGTIGNLDKVTFEGNKASVNGGAILNSGGKIGSITNGVFKNNTSVAGGGAAIYNKNGEIKEISNTVFEGNIAEKGNGAAIFNGGSTSANIKLSNVQFVDNQAKNGSGGAISSSGVTDISNAKFVNNTASTGAGAINVDGTVKLRGENTFAGNKVGNTLNDINLNQKNGAAKVDVSGTLTLDGGISGAGTTAFADNTKLNITENTTFANDVQINIGKNAQLGLIVETGAKTASFDTSKLLTGENKFTLAQNVLYNASLGADGKVTMKQKSASEAAAAMGASGSQANAVLGAIMGGSSNNVNFNNLRAYLNQNVQSADKAQVANAVSAAELLTADENPVVRSVETGIHNMVISAVADELNGTSEAMAEEKTEYAPFKYVKAWIRSLFNKTDHEATSKVRGFDSDSNGVAMGIDKQIDNKTKLGVGYAYSSTDVSSGIRNTDVDTHTAFLYGQYKPANWYINTVVAYNWSDYSEKKSAFGFRANADYDVDAWTIQSVYGYEMEVKDHTVTPEAGLRYAHISNDGYTDALGTTVTANNSDILTAVAGVRVSKNYALNSGTVIRPEMRVAVTYDLFTDDNKSNVILANGAAYRTNGEEFDRLGLELGAKVATDVSDNWELAVAYEGNFRDDYANHTGMLNAKYKF